MTDDLWLRAEGNWYVTSFHVNVVDAPVQENVYRKNLNYIPYSMNELLSLDSVGAKQWRSGRCRWIHQDKPGTSWGP